MVNSFAAGSKSSAQGIWEAVDGLRDAFIPKGPGARANRGDVRSAILVVLLEAPMHGYQLIQAIEKRTSGSWKPSPGSVYPTLQLLTDEGLVSPEVSGERKIYALTEAGREVALEAAEGELPWKGASTHDAERYTTLPKASAKLAQAVVQVQTSASLEQSEKAAALIDETRRKLYAILAEG